MSAKGPITQHFMQIHPRGASQQMGEIYAKIFIYIRIPFFLERTWRSDPLGISMHDGSNDVASDKNQTFQD